MVVHALDGNAAAVVAAIQDGAGVDTCGRWEESEIKGSGFESKWTWKKDTAFTMACSQGDIDLASFLLSSGADSRHSVCNVEDVHYTGAAIARKHGHIACAELAERAVDKLEAPERAQRAVEAEARAAALRTEARAVRLAGPPYHPSHKGGLVFFEVAKALQTGQGGGVEIVESLEFLALGLDLIADDPLYHCAYYCSTGLEDLKVLAASGDVGACGRSHLHSPRRWLRGARPGSSSAQERSGNGSRRRVPGASSAK